MKQLAAILLAISLMAPAAFAKSVAGVDIPASFTADGKELLLNGAGIRKKLFIEVYVAALYTEKKSTDGPAISAADAPMAIRLFITSDLITKEKMLTAINDGFAAATGGDSSTIQPQIDLFNSYFNDPIHEKDVIDLIYTPRTGLKMVKNGTEKGVVPGLAFKQALFTIWLGKKPADKKLKKGMLN